MISALLASIMIFAVTYGQMQLYLSLALCGVAFVGIWIWRRRHKHHTHGAMISIDYQAQLSRLRRCNGGLKVILGLPALLICVASDSDVVALAVWVTMTLLTVALGGTRPSYYFSLMLIPILFILLSGVAIVFETGSAPLGYWDVPLFGGYLSITPESQHQALHVMVRAMGAVSCLYMISLSTPMAELIGVLKKAKLPAFLVELLYLIYRYIFIVMEMLASMNTAADCRLGRRGAKAQFRTFLNIGGSLMVRSFQRARTSFDAMEARCYDGRIAFLERESPLAAAHVAGAAAYLLAIGGLWALKLGGMIP